MPKEKITKPQRWVELDPPKPDTGEVFGSDSPNALIGSVQVGTVTNDNSTGLLATLGTRVNTEDAVLQVGWHRDGWVQVSIEADLSYFRFAAENPDGETSDRSTVYTPVMDRDEINKMIRCLRRAREQVFGKDE